MKTNNNELDFEGYTCPVPIQPKDTVVLGHGSGGRLSHDLINRLFLPEFGKAAPRALDDSAILNVNGQRLAVTTDSHVVSPLFFPGGDIGRLAVCGTVNDLAMVGAKPIALTCGFVIEEGLSFEILQRIVNSMRDAAAEAGVYIAAGDTKVVEHGKGDAIFINTSGIGTVLPGLDVGPHRLQPGDEILVSGPIGLHGIAIMAVRENLGLETTLQSDSGPVFPMVEALAGEGLDIHMLRDPTRGGVSSALNETARQGQVGMAIDEEAIPIPPDVEGACEILGLDPLHVANEGNFLATVAAGQGERALTVLRRHPSGRQAALIGRVVADHPGVVVIRTALGSERLLDMMSGEQLPRIC